VRPRLSLRVKLAAGTAFVAIVPALAAGWGLYRLAAAELERSALRHQQAVADDVASRVGASFTEAQNGVEAIGRALTDLGLRADVRLAEARDLVAANAAIDQVAVYDPSGAYVDGIREDRAPRLEAPQRLDAALMDGALRAGVAVGRATAIESEVRIPLVVPIRAAGVPTGFVMAPISLDPTQRNVAELAATRFDGDPDSIYLVDDTLRIVAQPRLDEAVRLRSISDIGLPGGMDRAAFAHGVSTFHELVGPDGERWLGTFTPLAGRPLAVVTQVPRARAFATLDAARRLLGWTVLAGVALALVVGLWFARSISRPVGKLVAFARDLAARRFDQPLDVRTGDELEVLAGAMTTAASDLDAGDRRREREAAIRVDLGRYLPAELVDKVVRREHDMSLGGTRRQITVLFADVVGFTPMAEKRRPEDMVALLGELFTMLTEIVVKHGGVVDKFIGDCLMAMWGAVDGMAAEPRCAVDAALEMLRWLDLGRASWTERFGVDVRLAIGLSTGEAIVGNVGSERQMQFTAIGDVVNVAARVETVARPNQVLCTRATRDALGDAYQVLPCGAPKLGARSSAVELFEVRQ
jgi:class 3 adenylate cyclase